jgi:uncharacterized protein (DUF2147 family)
MKTLTLIVISTLFTALSFAGNADVLGQWYTTDKGAIVEVYQCGDKLCGKIIWLKEPNTEEGKPKTDINNPEASKHNRPIIGLNMLKGFEPDGNNEWENGEIYDPKNGKTYSCNMELKGEVLEVRGYIGISLFGRTEKWTRVK